MNTSSFLSGLEEVAARLISLVMTVSFFAVYMVARESIELNWQSTVQFLGLFWFIYEVISYLLYTIFRYFGDKRPPKEGLTIPVDESKLIETPQPVPTTADPVA